MSMLIFVPRPSSNYARAADLSQVPGLNAYNKHFSIKPAQVLCVMIMNIVVAAKPLYKMDEWLLDYLDGKAEDIDNAHLALITETRPGIPLQHLHML